MNVMTAKPNLEIPLSLRAATELVNKRKGREADEHFDHLAQAATKITKTAQTVQSTVAKILANQLSLPIKRASDARNAAHKIFMGVAPDLDKTRRAVESAVQGLEAATLPPAPRNAVDAVLAAEIRTALSRMPPADRAAAVHQAINDGDDAFVGAATQGNVALVGFGPAEQAALRDAWRRKRHAATVERVTHLKEGLAEFNRLSSLLSGWSLGLLAKQDAAITAAEESERQAKAAQAGPKAPAEPTWQAEDVT